MSEYLAESGERVICPHCRKPQLTAVYGRYLRVHFREKRKRCDGSGMSVALIRRAAVNGKGL